MASAAELLHRAIQIRHIDVLQKLLEAGVSPNIRLGDSCTVSLDYESIEKELDEFEIQSQKCCWQPPDDRPEDPDEDPFESAYHWRGGEEYDPGAFDEEEEYFSAEARKHWYPIQHAARLIDAIEPQQESRDTIMTLLLDHDADMFAVFQGQIPTSGITLYFLDDVEARQKEVGAEAWQRGWSFGPCMLLHSMLEDGFYVYPILTHPMFKKLDLETRDPRGRTVFLAACRSRAGTDVQIEYSARDVHLNQQIPGLLRTQVQYFSGTVDLWRFFTRGDVRVNLMATDDEGKNLLHALYESFDPVDLYHQPDCRGVTWLHPELFARPDIFGVYPLHSLLRRFMYYLGKGRLLSEFTGISDDERQAAQDIVKAPLDRLVVDGRGNTTLHYLVSGGRMWGKYTHKAYYYLLYAFLDDGPSVNVRNLAGQSALEWILGIHHNNGYVETGGDTEIHLTIWAKLDAHGADWSAISPNGNTLIHLLAASTKNPYARSWIARLLAYGVDASTLNRSRETALQIARRLDHTDVVSLLETAQSDLR